MIKVEVHQVRQDQFGNWVVTLWNPEMLLQVPIWVGEAEAMSIAIELEQRVPPRPLAHDLIRNVLEAIGVKVERVEVSDLQDDTFYAVITLNHDGQLLEIDARPSDSIALALRAKAPIYLSEQLARKVGTKPPPDPKELQRFMRLVRDVELT